MRTSALGAALEETVRRHAVLVTAAEPFRTHRRKFARLLKARGGLAHDDLQAFRTRLGRVREWRRARAISAATAGRPKAPARPTASEQYPELAADVRATLARLKLEAGQRQGVAETAPGVADMPEDPGRAEYAASLDAEWGAGAAAAEPTTAELYGAYDADFRAHLERCAGAGLNPVRAEGFDDLRRRALALVKRPDLAEAPRRAVETMLAHHGQYVNAPGRFAQFVSDLEASARRYEAIQAAAADAGNAVDRHPDYPGWRAEAERLETFAGETVAASPGYNRHLNENPQLLADVRAGLDRMRSNVRRGARAEARTEYRRFLDDWNAMRAEARVTGVHPFYQPGYPAMRKRADALSARPDLPDDIRDNIADFMRNHAVHAGRRDAVRDLDARFEAHFDAHEAILDEAIAGRFAEREHPDHVAWTLRAAALAAEASAMLEDTGTYGIHLDARLDLRIRIESNASAFESHCELDRKRAPLPARPRAPKPASGVEPEPEEPAIGRDIDPRPGIGF